MGFDVDPTLPRVLRRAARRLTAARALTAAAAGAIWVLAALTAVTVAGAVVPVSTVSLWPALAGAGVAAVAAAVIVAVGHRTDLLLAAQVLDRSLHLDERASTACELLLGQGTPRPLGRRVLADAAARLSEVEVREAIPLRIPRRSRWIPVLAAVLMVWPAIAGGLVLPGTPASRAREGIHREGARIEEFAQRLQARARAERLPLTRRTAPQMRDLGVRLQQERIDRASALTRLGELSHQIDAARREVDQRLEEAGRPQPPLTLPSELLRRQVLQRQIRQLQELTSRLREDHSTVSKEMLDRLGAITRDSDGSQPAQFRQQLQQAQRQLESGNVAGAGESLNEALRTLEGLERLLADREGLESARQQLERSRSAISSGAAGAQTDEQTASSGAPPPQSVGPGDRPVEAQSGAGASAPPEGPREGVTPGAGRGADSGPSSPRLEVNRTPQRVRGAQGEGEVSASEVVGAGRRGTVRTRPFQVSPAVAARVDRALERARVPAQYRLIVLRYFERLAQMK